MFAKLMRALRGQNILADTVGLFDETMEDIEWMFATATDVLKGRKAVEEVKDTLYARDRAVNEKERHIRRDLLLHLSLRKGIDAPACLVLMVVTKDAERVGDYCKNLLEVAEMFGTAIETGRYATQFTDIIDGVAVNLSKLRSAFAESDETMAQEIIRNDGILASKCEMIIRQLIDDNLPTKKAVAYTLLARHLKRVSRHTANVASSVVTSVEYLDYIDEPGRETSTSPPTETE